MSWLVRLAATLAKSLMRSAQALPEVDSSKMREMRAVFIGGLLVI